MAPGLDSGGMVRLEEDLPDSGGDHIVLALGHVRQRIAHEVDAAALPGGGDAGDGRLQPFVRVGDDQLHAIQPAPDEIAQECRPERLGLARADVQLDDLALGGRRR